MKRVLLLFIPLMFFFGCDSDEGEGDCLLYGTWNLNYIEEPDYDYPGGIYCFCGYLDNLCYLDKYGDIKMNDECISITFLEDGGYQVLTVDPWNTENYSGTWTGGCLMGDSIFFVESNGGNGSFFIISISEDNLVFSYDDGYSYINVNPMQDDFDNNDIYSLTKVD